VCDGMFRLENQMIGVGDWVREESCRAAESVSHGRGGGSGLQ
jgi:hypothetical protein